MTSHWGPLGWMTLHSISCCYPEKPKQEDKLILNRFLEKFKDTISCPHCKTHFTRMHQKYTRYHPEWSNSRYDLFLFVCRAHNTVNKRLDKPKYSTVKECLEALKANTKNNSAANYRIAYISYLFKNWGSQQSGEGFMMLASAKELAKINNEYWTPRNVSFEDIHFPEADVLEYIPEDGVRTSASFPMVVPGNPLPNVGFKLRGGRFSLH
jgi:hypothetical protein